MTTPFERLLRAPTRWPTRFSAAAYYVGRKLERTLHAPVGMIDSTVGGTRIELWTPADAAPGMQSNDPKYPPASPYSR